MQCSQLREISGKDLINSKLVDDLNVEISLDVEIFGFLDSKLSCDASSLAAKLFF